MHKVFKSWKKDGVSTPQANIDGNGVWELFEPLTLRSDVEVAVFFSSVSADASGATVAAGIRVEDGLTPVPVTDGSKVLSVAPGAQDVLAAGFLPKGRICLTVTGYVAPFVATVTQ